MELPIDGATGKKIVEDGSLLKLRSLLRLAIGPLVLGQFVDITSRSAAVSQPAAEGFTQTGRTELFVLAGQELVVAGRTQRGVNSGSTTGRRMYSGR